MIPAAILNDYLRRLLPVAAHVKPDRLQKLLQTPYLTFAQTDQQELSRDDAQALGIIDEFLFVRTPFPVFRFCMTDSAGRGIAGCIERTDAELQMVAIHRQKGTLGPLCWAATFRPSTTAPETGVALDGRLFDTRSLKDVTSFVKETEAAQAARDKAGAVAASPQPNSAILKQKIEQLDILNGNLAMLDHVQKTCGNSDIIGLGAPKRYDPPICDPQTSTFLALYNALLILCYEYLAPHNFTARVTPSTPGKSTEWLRAREHYTVIHRHHPANSKALADGSIIPPADDPRTRSTNATRLAHSRRAHTKLLTHPRWTFARGKRVFVRASWVGPKEWKDTAGQTYQILVPAPASSQAATSSPTNVAP